MVKLLILSLLQKLHLSTPTQNALEATQDVPATLIGANALLMLTDSPKFDKVSEAVSENP